MFQNKKFKIPKTFYFESVRADESIVNRGIPVSSHANRDGEKEALTAIVNFTNDKFGLDANSLVKHPNVDLLLRSITTTKFINKTIGDLKLSKIENEKMMLLSLDLENLENIGDAVLKEVFLNFVFVKYDDGKILNRRHGQMIGSRLLIEYMRTKYQSQMCVEIGLSKFIRHYNETTKIDTIQEDVFEAWIGACRLTIGYDKVYNFLMNLFLSLKINTDFDTLVDAKTQLNDLAATLAMKVAHGETKLEDDVCKVFLTMGSYTASGTGPCDSVRGMPSSKSASIMAAKNLIRVFIDVNGQQEYMRLLNQTASYKKWKTINIGSEPQSAIPCLNVVVKRGRDEQDERLAPEHSGSETPQHSEIEASEQTSRPKAKRR